MIFNVILIPSTLALITGTSCYCLIQMVTITCFAMHGYWEYSTWMSYILALDQRTIDRARSSFYGYNGLKSYRAGLRLSDGSNSPSIESNFCQWLMKMHLFLLTSQMYLEPTTSFLLLQTAHFIPMGLPCLTVQVMPMTGSATMSISESKL